jgi:hypothetical protein
MLHFRSGPRVPFGPAVLRILDGDLLLAEREVDVAAEEVDLGVVEVPLVKVRVRVVDSLGLVVPEASVGADCTRGTVRIRSDSNGEAFLTLPSGVVAVVRATSGRAASPAVVLRNERGEGQTAQQVIPIELRLEQGAWIVLLRGGAPVTTGVSVVARALGEETNPGAASGPELDLVPGPPSWQRWIDAPFGFSPLPPGRFRLTVREGDRVWERDIECAAGRLTEVDLSR